MRHLTIRKTRRSRTWSRIGLALPMLMIFGITVSKSLLTGCSEKRNEPYYERYEGDNERRIRVRAPYTDIDIDMDRDGGDRDHDVYSVSDDDDDDGYNRPDSDDDDDGDHRYPDEDWNDNHRRHNGENRRHDDHYGEYDVDDDGRLEPARRDNRRWDDVDDDE